jgi:hypothetical protein
MLKGEFSPLDTSVIGFKKYILLLILSSETVLEILVNGEYAVLHLKLFV